MAKVSLNHLKKELNKFEINQEDETYYVPALVLLASLVCGPNTDKIAQFINRPRSEVRGVGKRVRKNGIWKNSDVYCDWFNTETGGISFILDVNVAAGFMEKRANA